MELSSEDAPGWIQMIDSRDPTLQLAKVGRNQILKRKFLTSVGVQERIVKEQS
jgi:hypothetical protein